MVHSSLEPSYTGIGNQVRVKQAAPRRLQLRRITLKRTATTTTTAMSVERRTAAREAEATKH